MPGPVSDSFDPEFGTGENCEAIREELRRMYDEMSKVIGSDPLPILEVVRGAGGKLIQGRLEKDWRILRFALERALETI